ncbi:DUF397 domain-containing protein [Streptomyces sp. NPDC093589]|uniref:DUF397 domain-containing protein n=1 Tax=Streptomyces sp. NPDC093589 TaxID=3366043 RepID=UPI00380EC600
MTETPNWHTSTYTKSDNCVEVADSDPVEVKVRDSKRPAGAVLAFPQFAWGEFVDFVKL